MMGFLAPNQGRIHIHGFSVQKAQKRQLMAYVPQADEVDWNFPVSVFDVVMMGPLRLYESAADSQRQGSPPGDGKSRAGWYE